MIHRDIVLFCSLFLLLLVLNFKLGYLCPEHLLPFFTKYLHINELIILNACIKVKHRRVSVSELEIEFAHLPLEVGFVELGEILRYDGNKLAFLTEVLGIGYVISDCYNIYLQKTFEACHYKLPSSWNF